MAQTTPSPAGPAPPRAFVHVGAPKTGTTFVQSVLWRNREALAADGVLYPYQSRQQHFPAMLDLRERNWGATTPVHSGGVWDSVAERARGWTGHTVVLGNEILGGATERQIRRLLDSLAPAEVHVIFTARDLARQMVSDWQEHIKHRHTITLEEFVDELIEHGHAARPPFGEMFWGLHDADHVLRRWADQVPAERIHLVTLPPPGSAGNTLWERFCAVTGLDPERYSLDVGRSNTSLGRAEAEVVRRINARVRGMQQPHYDALVRLRLTGTALTGAGGRIVLPEGRMPWVRDRSRALIDALADRGYDVVGDLEELMPRAEHHEGYVPTGAIPARQMLPIAIKTNAALLRIAAGQRSRIRRYRRQVGDLPPEPQTPPDRLPLRRSVEQAVAQVRHRLRRR
ncbi:MAG TPA: hypothetical protein VHG70_11480 [Nocardioidaceae bacterium]|nr:hypothetical protein [Nocardioidaceae bacterium]